MPSSLRRKILFPTEMGWEIIEVNNMLRCEASGAYTKLFLEDSPTIRLSAYNLVHFERLLESKGFRRCHRSHLVNMEKICRVSHRSKSGTIFLVDGSSIPLSSSQKHSFMQKLQEYFSV